MISIRNLLSILILATSIRSFEFDMKKLEANPLFSPFGQSLSLVEIEKIYQKFVFEKLDYHLVNKGKLHLVLHEIATFKLSVLNIGTASLKSDRNINSIKIILREHESSILAENLEPLKADLLQFYKNIAKKLVGLAIEGSLSSFFLTSQALSTAVQTFQKESRLTVLNWDTLFKDLEEHRKNFVDQHLPSYEVFISFRINFFEQVDQILQQLLELIFKKKINIEDTEIDMSTNKLIALIETAMLANKQESQPFKYAFSLTKTNIFGSIRQLNLDAKTPFISSLIQKIFNLFTVSHLTEVMFLGKSLFLDFFMKISSRSC